jgi:PadR family transcriptional regulator, regulatory protein PadR
MISTMGRKRRRITDETAAVLALFLSDVARSLYGLEIIKETGISSGSLYPILLRLEARGVIDGVWEQIDESTEGRRRRRYHRITPDGVVFAREALVEWSGVVDERARVRSRLARGAIAT